MSPDIMTLEVMSESFQKFTPLGSAEEETIGQLYWNVNMPPDQWTSECPEFLASCSQKDIGIMSTRDQDFRRLTWSEVITLIGKLNLQWDRTSCGARQDMFTDKTNHIELFERLPSDLRRYLCYTYDLKKHYGSILNFVQNKRLHWADTRPSHGEPFTNPSDYKILFNDWPYGIDRDITHLCIWTKFPIEEDPRNGMLTVRAKAQIEDFVVRTFCNASPDLVAHDDSEAAKVERQDLIWFRNWTSLRSVHSLEHFHVMLYKASPSFLAQITNDDEPMSVRLG